MKTSVLLKECSTLATTSVLRSNELRQLLGENLAFLKAGALLLDLRESVQTFEQAAKHEQFCDLSPEARDWAASLDDICPSVLVYDPVGAAGRYRDYLRSVVRAHISRARKPQVREQLERGLAAVSRKGDTLSIQEVVRLFNGLWIAPDIEAACKYYYCVVGGEVTNAIPIVPFSCWSRAHRRFASPDSRLQESDTIFDAHRLVVEWFGIDGAILDRLSAEEILDLRVSAR